MNVGTLTKQTQPASIVPQTQSLYIHLSIMTKIWARGSQQDSIVSFRGGWK